MVEVEILKLSPDLHTFVLVYTGARARAHTHTLGHMQAHMCTKLMNVI